MTRIPVYQVTHSLRLKVGRYPPPTNGRPLSQSPPNTLQAWMPIPSGATPIFNRQPTLFKDHPLLGCKIAYWNDLPLRSLTLSVTYQDSGKYTPRSSVRFIRSCLAKNAPLTEIDDTIKNYAAQFHQTTAAGLVKAISRHLVSFLDYSYPPLTRQASQVLSLQTSDCGGYHALLVAILRFKNIPSTLNFGWRVGVQQPHVWATWWDKEKKTWNFIDLNDLQEDRPYSPRILMTLGTNPQLDPPFPRPIEFLQGGLAWCPEAFLKHHGKFTYEANFSATPT